MYKSPFKKVRKTKEGLALKRWFKEEWKTPEGKEEYSKGDSGTFRPTKKISKDTPKTYAELSPSDLAAAKKERKAKGRVSKYDRSELKKNSPAKQTKTNADLKIGRSKNTTKATNKPKQKKVTNFTSNAQEVSGPKTNKSNQYRTWKDFHNVEKGGAIFAGGYLVPSAIVNTVKAYRKK